MNTHMNSKIDIFQDTDSFVYRNNNIITQPFSESYEHIGLQNQSAKLLTSASNILLYSNSNIRTSIKSSIINNVNQERAKFEVRKMFYKINLEKNENNVEEILKGCTDYKYHINVEKYKNNEAYIKLDSYISSPRFHEYMLKDKSFLKFILEHPLIVYHTKYEELNRTYRKYLCPYYSASAGETQFITNNASNSESEFEDQVEDID